MDSEADGDLSVASAERESQAFRGERDHRYDLLDAGVLDNPYPLYDELRTAAPVYRDRRFFGCILTRYNDIVAVLKDGRVTVDVSGAGAMTMPMPLIDMSNIGSAEGGLTPAQVAFTIMRQVTTDVVDAATQALANMKGIPGAAAVENAKQIGEAIKGIFGGEKKKK